VKTVIRLLRRRALVTLTINRVVFSSLLRHRAPITRLMRSVIRSGFLPEWGFRFWKLFSGCLLVFPPVYENYARSFLFFPMCLMRATPFFKARDLSLSPPRLSTCHHCIKIGIVKDIFPFSTRWVEVGPYFILAYSIPLFDFVSITIFLYLGWSSPPPPCFFSMTWP